MKNPLEKEKHTGLISGIVIGGIVAAGLAYLFLTEDGEELLESLKHKAKDLVKDLASGVISAQTGINKGTVKKVADHVVE